MRHVRTLTALSAAAALVLSGCAEADDEASAASTDSTEEVGTAADEAEDEAGDDVEDPSDDEQEAASDPDDAEDPAEAGDADAGDTADDEADGDGDGSEETWRTAIDLEEPVVHDDQGVRLVVTRVGFTDLTADEATAEMDEFDAAFLEDASTLVVLEMEASNDAGDTIDLYANQGTIQLGREQVEADLFLSDSFAGSDWRDGVDDSGLVVWLLDSSYEDAIAAGSLDYVASAPTSSETWDPIGEEIELTVVWDAR